MSKFWKVKKGKIQQKEEEEQEENIGLQTNTASPSAKNFSYFFDFLFIFSCRRKEFGGFEFRFWFKGAGAWSYELFPSFWKRWKALCFFLNYSRSSGCLFSCWIKAFLICYLTALITINIKGISGIYPLLIACICALYAFELANSEAKSCSSRVSNLVKGCLMFHVDKIFFLIFCFCFSGKKFGYTSAKP